MSELKLPSGASVITFPVPPADFDPLSAKDEELRRYGLPPRPVEHPDQIEMWEKAIGRPTHFIRPLFGTSKRRRHGPRLRLAGEAIDTSPNWSGVVAFATAGSHFRSISGQWEVPDAGAASGDGDNFYSSHWVGIDGDGSNDVFQAGTECDAAGPNGTARTVQIWWEWYPEDEVPLTNFPVAVGQTVSVLLTVLSDTSGNIVLRNLSTGAATAFQVSAPGGTILSGNSAEWIVERPEINGVLPKLADYGEVVFDGCVAATDTGVSVGPLQGDLIFMVDAGVTLSEGGITRPVQRPAGVRCLYTGPQPGIDGYDLFSVDDHTIPFDYDSSGKLDHLVFYRAGGGDCYIVAKNADGTFAAVYASGTGIGGYDLRVNTDRAIPFDYDSSGKLDHLVFYRPGGGACYILKKNPDGTFAAVFASGTGIGGYDLRVNTDRAIPFDYDSSGKLDHLIFYRPGDGIAYIIKKNPDGTFSAVYVGS
jgi:Peptidase A4 family